MLKKPKQDGERRKRAEDFVRELDRRANAVRDESEADVYFYTGPMRPGGDGAVLNGIQAHKPKLSQALLVLCTYGGSPDVAYRIARFFLSNYKDGFTVLVDGYCFSAGTLLALGAHELAISDNGALGPLDTQIAKIDELFSNTSGLTGVAALDAIRQQAYQSFESTLVDMKLNLPSEVSLRTAIDASVRLTTGLYAPVFGQIDPLKLGEDRRALDIAKHYGMRLAKQSDNLKEDTLEKLLVSYPSHNFVIDRDEAKELFKNVRDLTDAERELVDHLSAKFPSEDRVFFPASDPFTPPSAATASQTSQEATDVQPTPNGPAKNPGNTAQPK